MRVLITGGAGFIGLQLVDELLDRDYEVTVIDNLSTGKMENISHHEDNENFHFIEGDITNRNEVRRALKDIDRVIHTAAITSVPLSIEKPELTERVNVEGTKILLENSIKNEVQRFVFSSSCAVYGRSKDLPISEDSELNPMSPYGESKLDAERHCRKFSEKGLETVCLRYFNVYGPRQALGPYAGVILKFLERVKEGEPPVIYGDGEQTRDFVHVGDIVKGTLLGLEKGDIFGEAFNLGTGTEVSINELCKKVLEITKNSDLKPVHEESKPGDIRRSRADLSKPREELGYEPSVSLEDGLLDLVNYMGV